MLLFAWIRLGSRAPSPPLAVARGPTASAFCFSLCLNTLCFCSVPSLPQLASGQQLRLNWNLRNATAPLRTWKGGVPVTLKARLNYMPSVQINRGWRKKNQAYPGVS